MGKSSGLQKIQKPLSRPQIAILTPFLGELAHFRNFQIPNLGEFWPFGAFCTFFSSCGAVAIWICGVFADGADFAKNFSGFGIHPDQKSANSLKNEVKTPKKTPGKVFLGFLKFWGQIQKSANSPKNGVKTPKKRLETPFFDFHPKISKSKNRLIRSKTGSKPHFKAGKVVFPYFCYHFWDW